MKTTVTGRLAANPKLSHKLEGQSLPQATFKLFKPEDYQDTPKPVFGELPTPYKVTMRGALADASQNHLQRGFLVSITGDLNEETNEILGTSMTILSSDQNGVSRI